MAVSITWDRIEGNVRAERQGAAAKFPGNEHMLAALVEEVGELSQALIDNSRGTATRADVYAEAIQVAAMAMRIAYEGSAEFPYAFEYQSYQSFEPTRP